MARAMEEVREARWYEISEAEQSFIDRNGLELRATDAVAMMERQWKRVRPPTRYVAPEQLDYTVKYLARSLYTYLCEHPSPATETQMRQEYKDWFAVFDAEQELLEVLLVSDVKD